MIDDTYPRPQLRRGNYELLDGAAGFAFDDENRGVAERWFEPSHALAGTITLPFSPESEDSGVGDTGFHRVAWYRMHISVRATDGERVLLHFGAVDRVADVWVDGTFVGRHEGGQTAFSFDVTHALTDGVIVVRAEDDPLDAVIPRGKQDWHQKPHAIWYHRTTGIWRSVWAEVVPDLYIADLTWTPDLVGASVRLELGLSRRPEASVTVSVVLEDLARLTIDTDSDRVVVDVPIAALRNGQAADELLWSPARPTLIDATVALSTGDSVQSYLGLRSIEVAHGRLMLNDRPFYVRSVLQQGYWPGSHFTAPSIEAMRDEIELIKRLGFNSIRIHQKVEDARYLALCDRLGLTVWAEAAAAYEFSPRAVELFTADWVRIVRSQASHPSVIVWVPFNESWGIQHVSHDPAQRAFSLALTHLTRSIDPSRPVISNDGWEHTDSDLMTIHDYEGSPEVLAERYGSVDSIAEMIDGLGGAGRRIQSDPEEAVRGRLEGATSSKPILLTEFGGVRFGGSHGDWGYSTETTAEGFEQRVGGILAAVHASPVLGGFCYTQLTDTGQEANGLCDENRVPKLDVEVIRSMVMG